MAKPPIQNQGFRLDLNLQESFDDDAAWDNLYNPGISKDLAILVNNLRNVSILGPGNDPKITLSLNTNDTNNAQYGVGDGTTYKAPHFFTCTKENNDLTDSTYTNDDIVHIDRQVVFKIGTHNGTDRIAGVAGPISQGEEQNVGTITLRPEDTYYVCNSNARNSFKLSTEPSYSSSGISTIAIYDIDLNATSAEDAANYNFKRNDQVLTENLEFFIKPEILDDEFRYLSNSSINGTFASNLNAYEYTEVLTKEKYKSNESIKTDSDVKFEGTVRIKDPDDYNANPNNHSLRKTTNDEWNLTPDAPGIFIGDTRAFSTDNNPWAKNDLNFSTESYSEEFTIGDLEFGGVIDPSDGSITDGKIKINGLNIDNTEIEDITGDDLITSTLGTYLDPEYIGPVELYKFPMIINGETFFVLVEKE